MADRTITVKIVGDDKVYQSTLANAESGTSKSGSVMRGIWQGVGQAITGFAADALGKVEDFVSGSITAADDMQVSTTKLNTALSNTGKYFDPSAIEKYTKAQEALGFTNTDTTDSLAALATAGLSVADAESTQAEAQDLA